MSKKYNLNLLVSLLSFFVMAILISIYMGSDCFDGASMILTSILFITYYVSKLKVKNKYINEIISIVSVLLFLFKMGIIVIVIFLYLTNILNGEDIYPLDLWLFVFNLYYLLRIFVDSIINYRKKEFNFSCILKIISLVIINLVLFRLLIDRILYGDLFTNIDLYEVLSKNYLYFFIMLFVCIINSANYLRPFRSIIEDILKVVISVLVTLTVLSFIDTLEICAGSYEYQPIICFYETHSKEKATYYAFGYSLTYHYGKEEVVEYRLFNLIPFYKR